jgi:hypothetical protein
MQGGSMKPLPTFRTLFRVGYPLYSLANGRNRSARCNDEEEPPDSQCNWIRVGGNVNEQAVTPLALSPDQKAISRTTQHIRCCL